MKRIAHTCCLILVGLFSVPGRAADTKAPIDFNRDIRPILSKNCYACHGPDAKSRTTKMRLDKRESATAKNKKGKAPILPGKPDESELIRRVSTKEEADHMPPAETGIQLTPVQIATLTRWIAEGASYAEHWAFVRPVQKPFPAVKNRAWPHNGIDYFVLDRLEKEGLRPSPEADR